MELEITKLPVPEGAFSAPQTAELPIECDILLPDYCPDILKILRCSADIKISSVSAEEGRVAAEGAALVTVLYVSDGMELCRNEGRFPFSKSFEFACDAQRSVANVTAALESLNCRAVSPRRIDVRGAFALTADLLCIKDASAVTDVTGGGVELLKRERHLTDILGAAEKAFTMRETGEIGYGKPEAASVVRVSGMARVLECRVIQDKVITKGEVSVNVLWLPQEEGAGPVASGFVFPVSQIMDFAGADEGCVCDARYRLVSVAAVITEDGRSFEVEAPVLAFVRLQRPSEVMLAEDAYSTRYKCDAAGKQFSALEVLAPVSEIMAVDEETDMPEGAISICDCWAEAAPVPELEKDGAVSCRARVCILAKNSEGSMEYFEKSFAAKSPSLFVPLEEQLFADVSASSDSAECSLSDGGRARIRFKIYADGCIYRLKKWPVLTDVSVDEEHPVGTCAPAMTLYYADPGEKVWDIAKRYGSTPSAVAQENAIEGDAVEDRRMLMIPAVI